MNQLCLNRLMSSVLTATVAVALCSCGAQRSGPGVIDPDAPKEFTTTESGLKYRILRKGVGQEPIPSDRVDVDYSGWLEDGTMFDSSYERADPATFNRAALITGWAEGIQLIEEGGMIELEVPPDLAYGEEGRPPSIPPNATLHFKIELHAINNL